MKNDEGDATNHRPNQLRRRRNIMSIPETPSAQRLRELNVRPQTCLELADLPLDLINACIADGQARPAVRDLAAWTVSMARDARDHGWQVALDKRGARPTDDFWADPDAAIAKLTARLGLDADAGADTPAPVADETPSTPPPPGGGDQQEATATDCPDWIAPARWQTLWRPLRDALYRSRLRGRTVIAADSWRQKQLDEEYKDEITSLVIAASMRRSHP